VPNIGIRIWDGDDMQTVLVTGAAGFIGTRLRNPLRGVYPDLRWSDIKEPQGLSSDEKFVKADLADIDQVARALQGVQGIVHLGGLAREEPWEDILRANISGCYNLFEAARRAGVERIVLASSNHVTGFYPRQRSVGTDVTTRPDSRYGVSKAFGEALGALYAFKYGLRVTCLRIGRFADRPSGAIALSTWIAPEDLVQLIRIGLEHPDLHYEIFYGMSDNARGFWDNSAAARYGYRPANRAEDHAAAVLAAEATRDSGPIDEWYQGGEFCALEFDGGIERSTH
jgi:uronate dehydrogenase